MSSDHVAGKKSPCFLSNLVQHLTSFYPSCLRELTDAIAVTIRFQESRGNSHQLNSEKYSASVIEQFFFIVPQELHSLKSTRTVSSEHTPIQNAEWVCKNTILFPLQHLHYYISLCIISNVRLHFF